jgi:hypothetical protein
MRPIRLDGQVGQQRSRLVCYKTCDGFAVELNLKWAKQTNG